MPYSSSFFLFPAASKADVMTGSPAGTLDHELSLQMEVTIWVVEQKAGRSLDLITM
jgi:hypothetical protein